ncbi:MAG: hypothetical protein LQ349_007123, partial [Xanthoria aureola]
FEVYIGTDESSDIRKTGLDDVKLAQAARNYPRGSNVSLCGYLGLADTKALRELHARIQPSLNRLADIIKQGYDKEVTGKGPAKTQIEVGKLFGYISRQNDVDISGFDPKNCP